ncbi:MAG: hypothetical protein M1839_000718 [Geoglossum umbratile]|nr:MAG: hypothetical protein M1839_000718 [Geoglossum umbratile]
MGSISVVGLAFNLTHVVGQLKEILEVINDAPEDFAIVVFQADRFARELDRLLSLEHRLSKDDKDYLQVQVNPRECHLTIEDLKSLVKQIKPAWNSDSNKSETERATEEMTLKERVIWLWKKEEVKKLVDKLQRQADRVRDSMEIIGFGYKVSINEDTVKIREDTAQIRRDAMETSKATIKMLEEVEKLVGAFRVGPAAVRADNNGVFSPFLADEITWHGQFRCKPGQNNGLPYFRDRDKLSNACYYGDWQKAMAALAYSSEVRKQEWVNCWRILASDRTEDSPSGYTPLHQAAYHGASREIVKELVEMGAWRLARTLRIGSSSKYGTPLDVARRHGWTHLYDVLSPIVRRPLRYDFLHDLQMRLNDLIREGFENNPAAHLECFVLPELEILTEFEHSRLWFPLQPELQDTRDGLAVQIILDREELVVILRWGRVERKLYRISRSETREISQAVVLSY